jgi:putative transposase
MKLRSFIKPTEERTTMKNDTKTLTKVVQIDEARIQDQLSEIVRGSVEETLNAMLDAEADALCGAQRYERSPDRVDTRGGITSEISIPGPAR